MSLFTRSSLFRAPSHRAGPVRLPFRLTRLGVKWRNLNSEAYPHMSVMNQLARVDELQQRVAAENSKTCKELIIAEYPDLRDLLELIYDPSFRTNLSYAVLERYLKGSTLDREAILVPESIEELLTMLSTKQVVGNKGKSLVHHFLMEHGIMYRDSGYTIFERAELETFGRLLDRNLIAGFGARTLSRVKWKSDSADTTARLSTTDHASANSPMASKPVTETHTSAVSTQQPLTPSPRRNLKSFPVALGNSIEPPFSEIEKSSCKWYASRKLDGVRVISFLDFSVPSDGSEPILKDVKFFSRTGKPFTSLAKVEEQMARFVQYPKLLELLGRDSTSSEAVSGGQMKRLVLDGEVCVMRERQGHQSNKRPDDGTGAGAIWSDHNLEEDFTSTVSEIRRMAPYNIAHPVYFIFDILPYSLFEDAKGPSTFGQRVEDIRRLGEWLVEQDVQGKVLRPLAQWEIKDSSEIDGMVARAAEEGWEGLVMRADKAYKGARSTDIRKFKKWQDAEYTVVGHDMSCMRLAVDGVFGEYEALAAIWILHKGVKVSVGSGFAAEQRIKFGQNPDLIVGKEVTVEYFSESASSSREGMSLRFPRVKQIWDEGKRSI